MQIVFKDSDCTNLKTALSREWLETNGVGGFASSTIIGANTRRHHALLLAALRPPVERYVMVSKFEERVVVQNSEAFICTNLYPGTVYPHGFNIQREFRLRPWPTFRYSTADFDLERTVTMVHGENTTIVGYHNRRSRGPVTLHVRPLLACREYNGIIRRHERVRWEVEPTKSGVSVQPVAELPRIYFHVAGTTLECEAKGDWYYRFTYPVEEERGLDYEEDLFTLFELRLRVAPGHAVYVTVTTDRKAPPSPEALLAEERERRRRLLSDPDPVRQALVFAADQFISRRGRDYQTVLAGYPWFTDWGRDTMIALPGLTLNTRRLPVARQILATFAHYCDRGQIPNVFPDSGETPEYNTVDASLWFVVAVWRFWRAVQNAEDVRSLLPALRDVMRYYREGTRYDIRADRDGLITAGSAGSQLTWMDVKVDGYVPTPRHGKPVEINALWLNAHLMMAELEEKVEGNIHAAVQLRKAADQIAGSFQRVFWNDAGGYLFDVVREDFRDPAIRPNQLFTVSLPFSPLTEAQQRAVLEVVTKHLLTPFGLRTLSPQHEKYVGRYTGNRWQRDCAYHQGTVWPWLMGAYGEAYLRVHGAGKPQKAELRSLLQPLIDHLREAGLGTISEIFDGDPPHRPVGCIAQAWSVAEVLRLYDLTAAS
ncbi:MAG: amylo-alpha-1,6-glucosidase [Verrucomicrobiae bacterium]|nr:amylo-alpha-1,6-glucosidase [Verrucomicrobiae bacterium]MDW8343763.1 amylo-alpha-1,6-glucosidase [Verrucomicrobiae bacterium]